MHAARENRGPLSEGCRLPSRVSRFLPFNGKPQSHIYSDDLTPHRRSHMLGSSYIQTRLNFVLQSRINDSHY